jgi:uncharacterized membrane protein YccC
VSQADNTPDLLVSDADRARAEGDLREHYEAGRLTLEEFQQRLDEVHAARTSSQLEYALRQLPPARLPTVSPRDTRWRSLALQYALVNGVAVLVWAVSGGGSFWPKWVLLVTLIGFARRVSRRSRRSLPPPPPPPPHAAPRP